MRKLVARSLAAALTVVFISGCSSTGGKKSFSWSSLNPMTYFAKSDSDSPVPKPSEQLAPTVTLPNAADVASAKDLSGGGTAPPSPYTQKGLGGTSYSSTTGQVSSTNISPQRGMYDPNGYSSSSLPLSQSSKSYDQYTPQSTAALGYGSATSGTADYQASSSSYQASPNSGYSTSPPARYALGGASYDIQQNQTQQTTGTLPAYATPALPYANNAGSNTSSYQMAPLPSQGSGYDTGLAQDPYRNSTSPYTGAGVSPQDSYSGYSASASTTVASLPNLPAVPNTYSNTRPAYDPGNTGYNPPNVPAYTMPPTGGGVQPAAATESSYTPGSVSRYSSTSSQATSTNYGSTGVVY